MVRTAHLGKYTVNLRLIDAKARIDLQQTPKTLT